MARPRKDGRPPARAVRIGKARSTASGSTWRVRAYAPTVGAPYGRVLYTSPTTRKPTSAVPAEGETVDEPFDRVERWLDQGVALSRTAPSTGTAADATPGRRDIAALSAL